MKYYYVLNVVVTAKSKKQAEQKLDNLRAKNISIEDRNEFD